MLGLCKKGKGRADLENSERFTFIDDAKVVLFEKKLLQRTRIASSTKWTFALGTGSLSSLALCSTNCMFSSAYDCSDNIYIYRYTVSDL